MTVKPCNNGFFLICVPISRNDRTCHQCLHNLNQLEHTLPYSSITLLCTASTTALLLSMMNRCKDLCQSNNSKTPPQQKHKGDCGMLWCGHSTTLSNISAFTYQLKWRAGGLPLSVDSGTTGHNALPAPCRASKWRLLLQQLYHPLPSQVKFDQALQQN